MAKVEYDFNPELISGQEPAPEAPAEPKVPEVPKNPEPEQKQEPAAEPAEPKEPKAEDPASEPQPEPELDDAKILETLRKKGFKGESLDDILKAKAEAPEPVKKTYDEETQKFLEYQERTGRGLKDWQELNKDLSKLSPIEAARDRIRKESEGADLTEQDINFLLEDKLGFDPTDEDLSDAEKAKFKQFYGPHINALKREQQKFNEPAADFVANKAENPSQPDGGKKVKLSNGAEVDADTYEQDRQKYLADRDAAVQSIKEDVFKLSYDGKDGKKELSFDYKYTDEDLHSMKSITEDVGGILSNYQKEEGFDHAAFNKDLLWTKPEFRNKAISALLSRARNEVISEMTANRKNLNFDSPNEPPRSTKAGYVEPGNHQGTSGPSVKFSLP